MKFFNLLILSLLMCIGSGVGQEHPPAPVSKLPEQGFATVYVYRLDEGNVVTNLFLWFKKTRSVSLSEQSSARHKQKSRKIAALRNKQYFMLQLPSGKYIFDTQSMWGNLKIDVVAGGEYYLRVDQGNDCPSEDPTMIGASTCESRNASITSVPPERWVNDSPVLQPIRSGDVKDRKLVIVPPGSPFNNSLQRTAGS